MTDEIPHPAEYVWRTHGGARVTLSKHGVRIDAPRVMSRSELTRLQAFLDRVRELMEDGGVIEVPKCDPLPVRPFPAAKGSAHTHIAGPLL